MSSPATVQIASQPVLADAAATSPARNDFKASDVMDGGRTPDAASSHGGMVRNSSI
jgi:hypothetical protein